MNKIAIYKINTAIDKISSRYSSLQRTIKICKLENIAGGELLYYVLQAKIYSINEICSRSTQDNNSLQGILSSMEDAVYIVNGDNNYEYSENIIKNVLEIISNSVIIYNTLIHAILIADEEYTDKYGEYLVSNVRISQIYNEVKERLCGRYIIGNIENDFIDYIEKISLEDSSYMYDSIVIDTLASTILTD